MAENEREPRTSADRSVSGPGATLSSPLASRPHDLPFHILHEGGPSLASYGDGCFICHRPFDAELEQTAEDVVPKWLLKRAGMTAASAVLPSGRLARYSNRKVPCCFDCNQRMSTSLEKPVSEAFARGCQAVRELDFTVLYLWLAKIYYGTRYRETGIADDVRDPSSPPMLAHGDLRANSEHLRRCLQHRPEQLSFLAQPGSIFVFRAGEGDDSEDLFDFFVPTIPPAELVAVRHAGVFVIGIFSDNGYWGRQLGGIRLVQAALNDLVLHPVQCDELALWFASEAGGAHTSSGCYDLITVGSQQLSSPDDPTGQLGNEAPRSLFSPQFVVEPSGAPRDVLNLMRTNTMLMRLNAGLTEDDIASVSTAERPPSTLYNTATQALVQADCFRRSCREVLRKAGWTAPGTPCLACGR